MVVRREASCLDYGNLRLGFVVSVTITVRHLLTTSLIPGPCVTQRATADASTSSSELLREALRRDVRQQLLLVGASQNVDFRDRDLIQPGFDDRPDGGKRPRGVDDEEFAHRFWVSILPDFRCL